jgi:flagellar hook assembly protein FlgD
VKAKDAASNKSALSAPFKVTTHAAAYETGPTLTFGNITPGFISAKTVINYTLVASAKMTLRVLNESNVAIATPLNNVTTTKGAKKVSFTFAKLVPAGQYFIELTAVDPVSSKKTTIVRSVIVDRTVPEITGQTVLTNIDVGSGSLEATGNFTLSETSMVTIEVFDSKSKLVKTVFKNRKFTSGAQSVTWDGTNNAFIAVADGLYTVKINALDLAAMKAVEKKMTFSVERNTPIISGVTDGPDVFRLTGTSVNTIRFNLTERSKVNITIYDADGDEVKKLVVDKYYDFGDNLVTWNGKDEGGLLVADGTYTYKINAVDDATNQATERTGTIRTDKTAPTITSVATSSNPFLATGTSNLTVTFTLSEESELFAAVYNSSSKVVRKIYKTELKNQGEQTLIWNGRDDNNILLPAGIYSIRIIATDLAKIIGTPVNTTLTLQR